MEAARYSTVSKPWLKSWLLVIFSTSAAGMTSPVFQCLAKVLSTSGSDAQCSMICEGSSTKSVGTLVPATIG